MIAVCRVRLAVAPERRRLAARALEFAAVAEGVKLLLCDDEREAQLVYSEGEADLRCQPAYYDRNHRFRALDEGAEQWWVPEEHARGDPIDYVGLIHRLIALLDEPSAPRRGAFSSFLTARLPRPRQAVLAEPMCERAAERIFDLAGVPREARAPRWPGGARFAVVLTHDVDGPEIAHPVEIGKSLAKFFLRRSRPHGWAAARGAVCLAQGRPGPFWGFRDWAGFEERAGLRSAFYFHVRVRGNPRHRHDPPYRVSNAGRWSVIRELADRGWEIGAHAAIRSREAPIRLQREREALEQLGVSVSGLRHHYWELDWADPWPTFQMHAGAGYRYDTSLAWKDRPGFRPGTSLPFRVWHPRTGESIDLIELPTALMDGHLFDYLGLDERRALAEASSLVDKVRAARGMLVLDWHERTFVDTPVYPGWGRVCRRLVESVRAAGDAWWALPREVAEHWRARWSQFAPAADPD